MAFKVEIAEPAENDIDEAVSFIALDSPAAAEKWKSGLRAHIHSLRDMPERFPVISEAEELGIPCRAIVHFSHRVVFRIDNESNTVYVLRVYHGARRPITDQDI